MTYRVQFAKSFHDDVDLQLAYWKEQLVPGDTIQSWFNRLFDTIDSLEETPRLFPVDEYESKTVGVETRKIVAVNHLVFYQVDDERHIVNIIALTHAATRGDAWGEPGKTE